MIEVVRPGALTTVQDLGRPGHASSGVSRCGAFDSWSARLANRLVGNRDDAALLEITLAGPELRFRRAATVALVGDEFGIVCDAGPVRSGENVSMAAGAVLSIGRAAAGGVRCWLAIAGGLDVPERLGSRATDLAGGFGGLEGRALAVGDRLRWLPPESPAVPRQLDPDPSRGRREAALRLLPGPDAHLLPGRSQAALCRRPFRVGAQSDRRGIRLEGEPIPLSGRLPLRSQPVLPGAVQLPASGEPIVLGIDAPVTGGYPWVAQLIEADLGAIAHLAPGAHVGFAPVDFAIATAALEESERTLAAAVAPR